MSDNNKPKNFFDRDSNLDPDKIRFEIPIEQRPTYQDRIPSGYDPMEQIYLRGRAMRNMSSGTMPWWVLISGWILFGGMFLFGLIVVVVSMSWYLSLMLLIAGIPILIVLRGTLAKIIKSRTR